MRIDKNLVVIGLSDEDTAHLRLLIRKAGEQLQQRWRWGSEEGADLVIVDTNAFAGQMARTRALAAGMRCAVITDDVAEGSQELRLLRPLKLPNVIDVLNRAGGDLTLAPRMEAIGEDLYLDFAKAPSSKLDPPEALARLFEEDGSTDGAALGLQLDDEPVDPDSLFKRDESAHKPRFSIPLTLDDDTLVERPVSGSTRSEARAGEHGEAQRPGATPGPNTLPPVKRGAVVDTTRHPLREYLDQRLLAGPAQIRFDATASLALDPKNGVFHSDGSLAELQAYVREPLARSDWRTLTTSEFNQIRDSQPARPYEQLIWLEALVGSDGRLAPQLDPGGTFTLRRELGSAGDLRHHARITEAMRRPARLNEIAAAANVPMSAVFDLVNAYHAIGLLEWQTRASLRAPKPEAGGGLFARLKRPFGKS